MSIRTHVAFVKLTNVFIAEGDNLPDENLVLLKIHIDLIALSIQQDTILHGQSTLRTLCNHLLDMYAVRYYGSQQVQHLC